MPPNDAAEPQWQQLAPTTPVEAEEVELGDTAGKQDAATEKTTAAAPARPTKQNRGFGLLVLLIAVLCASPDALAVRYFKENGVGIPLMNAWKYPFTFLLSSAFMVGTAPDKSRLLKSAVASPRHLLLGMVIQACNNWGFSISFYFTSAARALMLIAASPLWAAVLCYVFLGDAIPMRTRIALVCAMGSILIIVLPGLIGGAADEGSTLGGDLAALVTGVIVACNITVNRHARLRAPEQNTFCAQVLGMFIASCAGFIAESVARGGSYNPIDTGFDGEPSWLVWVLFVLDGFSIGSFYVGMGLAAAHVSGAESAMMLNLPAIFGPMWVFAGYGDVPSVFTFVGGAAMILTLTVHARVALKEEAEAKKEKSTKEGALAPEEEQATLALDIEGEPVDSEGRASE